MGDSMRLTTLESSFLDLEQAGLPLHVAAVVVLEGGKRVTIPRLRRLVASRIRRLPRFRQRVSRDALRLARPAWRPVTRIDLDDHLFHHVLRAPGHSAQLFDLCARIHETPLDRDRPLWEMHLIDGLEHDRQALLVKTHHAITDGIGGLEVAQVLFDHADMKNSIPRTHFANQATGLPWSVIKSLFGLAVTTGHGLFVGPGPFNGKVGPHRSFAAAKLPMDIVIRTKRRLGCHVDDVVVAVIAAALRRYLRQVMYSQIPTGLRTMLPVSTRSSSAIPNLGNQVTAVFMDLPTDTDDLSELVGRVASSKAFLRSIHAAEGATLAIQAAGLLPNPLHEALLRFTSELRFAHLILSDIPGLKVPLFLLGRRVSECYPMMPLSGEVGLSIAAVSMNGVMGVGVTADPGLVPEPKRLAKAIEWVLAHDDLVRGRTQRVA